MRASDGRRACHGARGREGPVLARLAMLARRAALRVAATACAPLFPAAARHGHACTRSGRESRFASRTGKLALRQRDLDDAVALRVQRHRPDRRPVAGPPAPAPRIALSCRLIQRMAGGQQRRVLAGMALGRGDVADCAVTVLVVVPAHERGGPLPRGVEVGEAPARELGPILGGAEQGKRCSTALILAT
jgi:hypothetical protein